MKPPYGVIILIFMLFLTEIKTAGNPHKKLRKVKIGPTAAEPDDEHRRDDVRTIQNIATPARKKKSPFCRMREYELDKTIDPTGDSARKLFLHHYEQKGTPNAPEVTLNLYKERYEGGSYHFPKEKFHNNMGQMYVEARRRAQEPFVQPHHQEMYRQHQDSQDHSGGPESSSRGKFQGESTQNSFVNRYQGRGPPNIPAATFELNTQRSRGDQHRSENVGDQSGDSVSGSGYNHPYTAPPMSRSNDMYPQFYIPPPEDLDF